MSTTEQVGGLEALLSEILGYFSTEQETKGFRSGHVQALVPTPQVYEWHVRFRQAREGRPT